MSTPAPPVERNASAIAAPVAVFGTLLWTLLSAAVNRNHICLPTALARLGWVMTYIFFTGLLVLVLFSAHEDYDEMGKSAP